MWIHNSDTLSYERPRPHAYDTLWKEEGDPWKDHRTKDERLGSVAVGRVSEIPEQDHFDNFVARESIRFLENYAKEDGPFFLVSSFLKPHDPFMPAQRFADMFPPENIRLSPTWDKAEVKNLPAEVTHYIERCPWTPELKDASAARQRTAFYYANLAQMDDCAGQVLRALTRLGLDRNTIVVYTSDHGEMLGDLGLWNKFEFYEGSCGVPLTVRMPHGMPALCNQPVSLISLLSTLADLCDVPTSGPSDGKSFANLVHQPDSAVKYGPVFAEYNVAIKPQSTWSATETISTLTGCMTLTSCTTYTPTRKNYTTLPLNPPIRRP